MWGHLWKDAPKNTLVEVSWLLPDEGMRSRYLPPQDAPAVLDGMAGSENAFFGVALRKSATREKEGAGPSRCIWVDWDDTELPMWVLPPTYVVKTVHGYHIYWLLTQYVTPEKFEELNKVLIKHLGGNADSCWYRNSRGRIPGSMHDGTEIKLVSSLPVSYAPPDIQSLVEVDKKLQHKICTGDSRGYPSRSELDMAVMSGLARAGMSVAAVKCIYDFHRVGIKYREHVDPEHYLEITWAKASKDVVVLTGPQGFQMRDSEMWSRNGQSLVKVSTFAMEVKKIYSVNGESDAIQAVISSPEGPTSSHTFTRDAFNSARQFASQLPKVFWQWLGNDQDARRLLPFLVESFTGETVTATTTAGRHGDIFVTPSSTLSATETWTSGGPMEYISGAMSAPRIIIPGDADPLRAFQILLHCNTEEIMYPALGWLMASITKPVVEAAGFKFPVLNIFGTQGCGKTTLIHLMMDFLGYATPTVYDSTTTRFVLLALLGSTNALPVALAEFRTAKASDYLSRYLRLSYDLGEDPRGRPDQTVTTYRLSAPIMIDGEDSLSEPALLERVIGLRLVKSNIQPGSDAHKAYLKFRGTPMEGIIRSYIQWTLGIPQEKSKAILNACFTELQERHPTLPHRVTNNFAVVLYGLRLAQAWCGIELEDKLTYIETSIKHSFNLSRGRNKMHVDDLVENLVLQVAQGTNDFYYVYDAHENILWFHFGSVFVWYEKQIRQRGLSTLGRDALASQLTEAKYITPPKVIESRWCYGVKLIEAETGGLDIPIKLNVSTISINLA